MNVNQVMLVGHVTRDPDVKNVNQSMVATFRLAINRSYKKGNEWVEKPTFVDVECWNQRAEYVKAKIGKGTEVWVRGRLESDEWEKDGERRSKLKIYALEIQAGKNRKGGEGGTDAPVAAEGNGSEDNEFPF
jgi:single-strand DNA-binding protein